MAIDNSKYWSWGLPYAGLDTEGSVKYWFWGLPYGFIFEVAAPPAGGLPVLIDGKLINEGILTKGSIIRC